MRSHHAKILLRTFRKPACTAAALIRAHSNKFFLAIDNECCKFYNEHCSRRRVSSINTVVTSREAILKVCRELVSECGLSALNMRAVALKCGVALGSLYNYFPSKSELTIAVIESVWQDIFHMEHACVKGESFPAHIQWIFERVYSGVAAYPNFFTAHSIGFASEEKGRARQTMERYFDHMKLSMREALEQDPGIRKDAFSEAFPASDFIDFVLSGLLTLLVQRKTDCAVLLEMIRRTIYDRS